jgi:hypothetical protein
VEHGGEEGRRARARRRGSQRVTRGGRTT